MRGSGDFFRARPGHQDVARSALLQQQFGRFHHGLGVKTAAHHASLHHVRDGNECHSLVMRKVRAHDGDFFVLGQARACVIEGFVKSVGPCSRPLLRAFKISQCRRWVHHGRKRGGIGRDDNILAQAALEAQPGTPKLEY